MRTHRRFCVVVLFLALFAALPAFGSTLTVTNNGDNGIGSLRAALATAAPGDTINFNLPYPATIVVLNNPLQIATSVTISGPGASSLAISGGGAVTVFSVSPSVVASVSGLTIENGQGFEGGGIYNFDGTLTLSNVTVANNSATLYGGGIFNFVGTVNITNSTLSGNSSPLDGAGIFNEGGTVNLTNSTLSTNSAGINGGGIWNWDGGAVTLTSVTFSANSAPHGSALSNYNLSTVALKNTVLANGGSGGNCWSPEGAGETSQGYNLSDDASCVSFLTASTDKNSTAAGLDPNGLQDNGGPTETVALLATSPAVDAVPVSACTESDGTTPLATDQRGVTRPQGPACDIGAFELVQVDRFASFTAKLDIQGEATGSFDLNSTFTLAAGSSGIDPLTEAVELQVGPYQVTIPAGSFQQLAHGEMQGTYVYSGIIGGTSLSVQIVPLGGNTYQFKASAAPVDFSALSDPVEITLTIGKNTGTTTPDSPDPAPRRHHGHKDRDHDHDRDRS